MSDMLGIARPCHAFDACDACGLFRFFVFHVFFSEEITAITCEQILWTLGLWPQNHQPTKKSTVNTTITKITNFALGLAPCLAYIHARMHTLAHPQPWTGSLIL